MRRQTKKKVHSLLNGNECDIWRWNQFLWLLQNTHAHTIDCAPKCQWTVEREQNWIWLIHGDSLMAISRMPLENDAICFIDSIWEWPRGCMLWHTDTHRHTAILQESWLSAPSANGSIAAEHSTLRRRHRLIRVRRGKANDRYEHTICIQIQHLIGISPSLSLCPIPLSLVSFITMASRARSNRLSYADRTKYDK